MLPARFAGGYRLQLSMSKGCLECMALGDTYRSAELVEGRLKVSADFRSVLRQAQHYGFSRSFNLKL
jgi:hypothetical protein